MRCRRATKENPLRNVTTLGIRFTVTKHVSFSLSFCRQGSGSSAFSSSSSWSLCRPGPRAKAERLESCATRSSLQNTSNFFLHLLLLLLLLLYHHILLLPFLLPLLLLLLLFFFFLPLSNVTLSFVSLSLSLSLSNSSL